MAVLSLYENFLPPSNDCILVQVCSRGSGSRTNGYPMNDGTVRLIGARSTRSVPASVDTADVAPWGLRSSRIQFSLAVIVPI